MLEHRRQAHIVLHVPLLNSSKPYVFTGSSARNTVIRIDISEHKSRREIIGSLFALIAPDLWGRWAIFRVFEALKNLFEKGRETSDAFLKPQTRTGRFGGKPERPVSWRAPYCCAPENCRICVL